ncbi:aminoglycoside 6-adenylyltransferase [Lacrimispora algidixylanolytica]|uniref:Aminoglycoside adenylyltransferase n=1 Tax=Lacrimispora algidixylanolytica TaxID=94868 RepID=A0A419T595_9FIRM|nr:aminoglycoside 6-adenylyltransferase [Lacrimispora algidixylanolytica]RKD32651.1 aminoglycoside adenylyltransferase [Lacrimispora algidixylanolytica]
MRNEAEMFDLILNTAREDSRILAVYMNGSRTNKNATKDIFQDYDIVYVVEEVEPFIKDRLWIDRFGERLYMQYPEEHSGLSGDEFQCYGWLIQFADGNRLDLHVESVEHARENIMKDRLCEILLDKNGVLPSMDLSTDQDYWVKRPSQFQFLCACNEFWWCLNNVAKGLWREEMVYAQDMVNYLIRKQLLKVLSWKVGILTDYSVSIGKSGKYMNRWLTQVEWNEYLSTYFSADLEEGWEAVIRMCHLFDQTARYVGDKLGYEYNEAEGKNSLSFLEHVRRLPKDAKEIY